MFKLMQRDEYSHKGDYGKILIVAGSTGMAGAAILCAKGALRTGAGQVQLGITPDILTIVQTGVPEATCVSSDNITGDFYQYDSIVFGPGIGNDPKHIFILEKILENYEKPVVIDADGLNIIAKNKGMELLKRSGAEIIITPHMGEAMRLLDLTKGEIEKLTRSDVARELNEKSGATVVLKGHKTIVFDGIEEWINNTGNSGMATAGAGDVLSGIIASLCGQKYEPVMASKLGVYIHGLAGDLAKEEFGEHGVIAGDLCYYAAKAMKSMIKG